MAAARKVSPAAIITERPSARSLAASLPMVVVLPEPLTPATRMTKGLFAVSITSGCATGASTFSICAATTAFTSAEEIPAPWRPSPRANGEIGANKHILDLPNGRGIELALGEKVGNSAAQPRGRALKPAVQPPPP